MSSTSAKLESHWGQIIYEVKIQTLKLRSFEVLAGYDGSHIIPLYSHLSNKLGGWNQSGGGAKKWKINKCGGGNTHHFLSKNNVL